MTAAASRLKGMLADEVMNIYSLFLLLICDIDSIAYQSRSLCGLMVRARTLFGTRYSKLHFRCGWWLPSHREYFAENSEDQPYSEACHRTPEYAHYREIRVTVP